MNSNVKIMVELQQYWDRVISSRAAINKINSSVQALQKDLIAARALYETLNKKAKELKNATKLDELTLTEMSGKIAKLEDRKKIIQTEKELHALEKEIDVIRFDIGTLEDKTLSMIDDLDLKEKDLTRLKSELEEKEKDFEIEKGKTVSEVTVHEAIVKENTEKFEVLQVQLAAMYKAKFLKMIGAREGKGIARVEGEICGFCNFKIPSFLAIDASKDDKVVNCTNCGKYIYK
jgi:uncharacterized protein